MILEVWDSTTQENNRNEVRKSGIQVFNDATMMDNTKYGEDNKRIDNLEREEGSMVSNLPLLFANGYPTSLEKITMVHWQDITCIFFNLKITVYKIFCNSRNHIQRYDKTLLHYKSILYHCIDLH